MFEHDFEEIKKEFIAYLDNKSTITADKLNEFAGTTNAKIVQKFLYERYAKK